MKADYFPVFEVGGFVNRGHLFFVKRRGEKELFGKNIPTKKVLSYHPI